MSTKSNSNLIDFDMIQNKELVGINDSAGSSLHLKKMELCLLKEKQKYSKGHGHIKNLPKCIPILFEWTENEKKRGYIIDFFDFSGNKSISFYWTVTDAFKRISFRVFYYRIEKLSSII